MTADARVVASCAWYFGLAMKVRSPGRGLLDAGDAMDLDVAVAFEAAVQPFG